MVDSPTAKRGMLVGVNQNYADALLTQNRGQQGTGESIAKNGDIKIVFGFLYDHRFTLSG